MNIKQIVESNFTKKNFIIAVMVLFLLITTDSAIYTVDEGHVGIVKRFGEAVSQSDPGIHLKMPFVDSVIEVEVRTRISKESMKSATSEQMPITAMVSVNWTITKTSALAMYKKYGGLDQFENRILDPKLRSVSKSILPKYDAEKLIRDRSDAITKIDELLKDELKDFDILISSVQIENIILPPKYIASIEAKQTAKNNSAAEEHRLAQQALKAKQEINTAEAKRDSDKARADGKAYATKVNSIADAEATKVKGLAEAEAITAKAKALGSNKLIIELTEAQRWNGSYLTTGLGEGSRPLVMVK